MSTLLRGRIGRILAWTAVVALALAPTGSEEVAARSRSLAARILGPIGALAASVQWVRFDAALDAGRPALAYARAAVALDLDPAGTEGWAYLASHLVFGRGSAEAEPDPSRRAAWIRAGLEVLERGEASAREPAALARQRGLILTTVGDAGGEIPWTGGAAGAYLEAAAAFERARQLGDPLGAELALRAREAEAQASVSREERGDR